MPASSALPAPTHQVSDVYDLREAGYEVLDKHRAETAEAEAMLALSE